MFRRIRIAILLYVLLFVAAAQFFAARRSTDWDTPLRIDVYPVNGDDLATTERYLDALSASEFEDVETFFAEQGRSYGLGTERPVRVRIVTRYTEDLPSLPTHASAPAVLWWSLRMRWLCASLEWGKPGPAADIVVFAVFHDAADTGVLDRSTALEKGLIVVANLFAARSARGTNQVVLAHELLHTLGARDKYDRATNAPLFPDGFAAPDASPRFPQAKAELMAGRIPVSGDAAVMPEDLRSVVVGAATAEEIGWLRR